MTTFIFLFAGVIFGFTVGWFMAARQYHKQERREADENGHTGILSARKRESRTERKKKILAFFEERGRVKSTDIEGLLGISGVTVARYLSELEAEDRIVARGHSSESIYYERM